MIYNNNNPSRLEEQASHIRPRLEEVLNFYQNNNLRDLVISPENYNLYAENLRNLNEVIGFGLDGISTLIATFFQTGSGFVSILAFIHLLMPLWCLITSLIYILRTLLTNYINSGIDRVHLSSHVDNYNRLVVRYNNYAIILFIFFVYAFYRIRS